MRPFTRLPLCLALFTFILSSCIQNKCSLPEFEGICQDKPSDMTMSASNNSTQCTKSNTNEQTLDFTELTTPHKIHAIAMIEIQNQSLIAFNLVNNTQLHLIALNTNDPCKQTKHGPYNIPSDTPQTQGIESIISTENSTATGQFSILCRINSAIERLTINSQLTPQFAKTENHKSWSLVSGNNGTLHAVIEYLPSISKDTFYQSLSVSTSPVFSNSNLAPVMPTNTESISKIIVGKFPSKYDGAIAWSANGTNVYYSILNDPINNIKYNTLSKTSQYPQISGCNDSALELCSVALADIIDGDAGELIVARHNGIMIYKDGTSNNTIFIPTETEPQAVSVSINNDKNMRKLIWASSKFENNKNTVTIHTIPVSSIM